MEVEGYGASQEEKHLSGDSKDDYDNDNDDDEEEEEEEDVSYFGKGLSTCLWWEVRNRVW
jgi:hypothetical protein